MSNHPSPDVWRDRVSEANAGLFSETFVSEWCVVTQRAIDLFAEATQDPDPVHVDPAWTRANTALPGTIAQGLWVTSMWVSLLHGTERLHPIQDALGVKRGLGLNYGYDKLRIVTPTFMGARLRGRYRFTSIEVRGDEKAVLTIESEMETEGQSKPCLAATWLLAFLRIDASMSA